MGVSLEMYDLANGDPDFINRAIIARMGELPGDYVLQRAEIVALSIPGWGKENNGRDFFSEKWDEYDHKELQIGFDDLGSGLMSYWLRVRYQGARPGCDVPDDDEIVFDLPGVPTTTKNAYEILEAAQAIMDELVACVEA